MVCATVLKPRYITRISWRVNLVSRVRSSKATGIGFGVRAVGSSSNRTTSSSIGLSGGVAMAVAFDFVSRYAFTANIPSLFGRSAAQSVDFRVLFCSTRHSDSGSLFLLQLLSLSFFFVLFHSLRTSNSFSLLIIVAAFQSFWNNARRQALDTSRFSTSCRRPI